MFTRFCFAILVVSAASYEGASEYTSTKMWDNQRPIASRARIRSRDTNTHFHNRPTYNILCSTLHEVELLVDCIFDWVTSTHSRIIFFLICAETTI